LRPEDRKGGLVSDCNLQVLLARRPQTTASEADFVVAEAPIPAPADGEVLVRNHCLSLDPYMRGRMNAAKSYVAPVEVGQVMSGATVGTVLASRDPAFAEGDTVTGMLGWQTHALAKAQDIEKVAVHPGLPLSACLGVMGGPGISAYVGVVEIGQAKPGETVVVSSAAGAVGSIAGQIARLKGCRVVGIAGGPEKCRYVVEDLGFDACVDYKSSGFFQDLKQATPRGVDVDFENVGGEVMDAVFRRLNTFSRVALCGLTSQYDADDVYGVKTFRSLLVNRVKVEGFIISDCRERWPQTLAIIGEWVREGRIRFDETVTVGLENAPRAFIGMFHGQGVGKQIVDLGPM
jgi:NADPH-dependent curcumin reductase CurA